MFDDHTAAAIDAARRRIYDIHNLQIPRLRQCESSLADQHQLSSELREDMDNVGRLVEELAVAIEDQQGEKARRELEMAVNEMRDTLSQLRRDTRGALLASKRAIDSRNARAVREELFQSAALKEKQNLNEKVTDDVLMKANDDVTETLRRTINLMQGELERSVLTTQMLNESTATLRATSQTHDTLNSLMLTSKQLITALEKADWLDRIVILSAFMFFVLVVLFILKQRFIDRGLRIALWWTRFIPLPDLSRKQTNVLKAAEEGSAFLSATATAVTSSLSSVVAATSSTLALSSTAMQTDSISSPQSIAAPEAETNTPSPLPSAIDSTHIEL
ncbi:Sec20-domain-containing protein [Macrolepiota fuliginosa MF-IS2]|uniref:Sec20-domain-containing protein n=1 Tax=Macrolepiota fuliginosa MF-IS2 TaxID=1400762 RepID=A0A9P5XMI8_9AGAR|nr:Sec20-domain-containing protein [Macrolepiota fuliginosa MF-IS2]